MNYQYTPHVPHLHLWGAGGLAATVKLLNQSATLDSNFYHYSPFVKSKFILGQHNDLTVKLILDIYLHL